MLVAEIHPNFPIWLLLADQHSLISSLGRYLAWILHIWLLTWIYTTIQSWQLSWWLLHFREGKQNLWLTNCASYEQTSARKCPWHRIGLQKEGDEPVSSYGNKRNAIRDNWSYRSPLAFVKPKNHTCSWKFGTHTHTQKLEPNKRTRCRK